MRGMLALVACVVLSIVPRIARAGDDCQPAPAPEIRRALGLTVHEPPQLPKHENHLRLRSHSDGSLSKGAKRSWIGPPVPSFVPLAHEGMELTLVEHSPNAVVGLYREMYGGSSCQLGSDRNCRYHALGFDRCGARSFSLGLNRFLSRGEHLEIQDLRFTDGTLYFNEACQSYSRQAGGRCSALLAVDAAQGKRLWRSHHRVSNHRLVVHGDYIVTGYGFTAESNRLYVVSRKTGRVVHAKALTSPQIGLGVADGELEVILYIGWRRQHYALEAWDSRAPRLRLLRTVDRPKQR
jgi:hypothetical protein